MEEEKKTEEVKPEEVKIEESEKKSDLLAKIILAGKKCKGNCCSVWNKDKKKVIIIAIVVVAVIAIIAGSFAAKAYWRKNVDVGPQVIKEKVDNFIKNNTSPSAKLEIKSINKDGDLYKLMIDANGQEMALYATRDGKKLIQQPLDLDQKQDDQNTNKQANVKNEAEQKTDVPTVDLFVMSYCPYGLQIEKGIMPVVETLGSKIKFNLKFVDYTMHGQKEVDENLNQYCISKEQPAKLNAYLKCFWKKSTSTAAACMKTTGVDSLKVKNCVAAAKSQFNSNEKSMGVNKEESEKYGVQGSPTLVVNGTIISSNRDSASLLKAICSGFTVQPKECNIKLSSVAPSAGFDDQAGGSSSSAAGCAQ